MHNRAHYRLHHLRRPSQAHGSGSTIYTRAMKEVDDVLYDVYGRGWERVRIEKLSSAIEEMKRRVASSKDSEIQIKLLALLLLQTPRAARAQDAMDRRHGHGYHNRSKRLYELIDFNDTFVDTVLALYAEQREQFTQRIFQLMSDMCRRARTHMFTREQFDAIVHGLSREIAVYLGARAEGLEVHMTSRVADGLGVDMQVRDPESGRYINIDCKTTSAYLRRVETLRFEGRLDEHQAVVALTRGFIRVTNGRGDERVRVVLFSVVTDIFGKIQAYEFADASLLALKLREAIAAYGELGDGFYRYEIGGDN